MEASVVRLGESLWFIPDVTCLSAPILGFSQLVSYMCAFCKDYLSCLLGRATSYFKLGRAKILLVTTPVIFNSIFNTCVGKHNHVLSRHNYSSWFYVSPLFFNPSIWGLFPFLFSYHYIQWRLQKSGSPFQLFKAMDSEFYFLSF